MSKAQAQNKTMKIDNGNHESGRTADGRFRQGYSGNPAGRPKRSEQERTVIEEMCSLVPAALDALSKMLTDDNVPDYLRLRAAEIVFDRIAGRPMTSEEIRKKESDEAFDEMFGFTLNL